MFKDLQGAQGIARKKARKAGEFETAIGGLQLTLFYFSLAFLAFLLAPFLGSMELLETNSIEAIVRHEPVRHEPVRSETCMSQ